MYKCELILSRTNFTIFSKLISSNVLLCHNERSRATFIGTLQVRVMESILYIELKHWTTEDF